MMMKRTVFVLIVLFIVLLSAFGFSKLDKQINVIANQYEDEIEFNLEHKVYIGSKGAPNTVVIFQDYECKRCKQFHDDVMLNMRKDIDSGKVKVYYYDIPFTNDTSYVKAMLGVLFEEKHRAYYDQYVRAMYRLSNKENKEFANKEFVKEKMSKLFPQLDLEQDIERVFSDDKKLVKELNKNKEFVDENYITKVPTVFVNGKKIKNLFYIQDVKKEFIR
jgi:protein-disulfide isomerase